MADNLKCGICNEEATVHLTQIVNNKIHKVDLCESCAQKKGVTDPEGFSLADLLSKADLTTSDQRSDVSCPNCGHDTADFRKTGRLGCGVCFEHFRDHLIPVLEDMHVGTKHEGKVPVHALKRISGNARLRELREAFGRAIAGEAYEDAARYRDEINRIEIEKGAEIYQA